MASVKVPTNQQPADRYSKWEFQPPRGVRVHIMDGSGKFHFHIPAGRERETLERLAEFVNECSMKLPLASQNPDQTGEHSATIPPPPVE